jgi:hypothetical protein
MNLDFTTFCFLSGAVALGVAFGKIVLFFIGKITGDELN